MRARSALYRAARLLGDAQAARKGPVPFARRRARAAAYRTTNRTTAKVLRRLGL